MKELLIYSETGGFQGGVEKFIFQAAGALRRCGVRVAGIFRRRGKDTERFGEAFDAIDFDVAEIPAAAARADWLWVHKFAEARDFLGVRGGTPIAVYVHDHDAYCFRRHKYWPLGRVNCPLAAHGIYCVPCGLCARHWGNWGRFRRNLQALQKVDAVMAGSEYMLDNLKLNGVPPQRLFKLPPLIMPSATATAMPPEAVKHRAAGREVLFVGQLLRGKGLDLLLRAVARIPGDWRLTVAGEGGDRHYCRRLAERLGISARVEFAGFVPDPERLYARATVLAFPSRWSEPYGMTGPEAFRHQVPVVGFEVGGVSEWLHDGENGVSVQARDVAGLAAGLTRLLDDPELAHRYGVNGAAFTDEFDETAFVRNFSAILEG